jgi:hypothetical protein
VGRERVSVPAGDFDAFKLFARGTLGGSSPMNTFYAGETTTTYWYAPSARAIVKSVHHNPYLGRTIVAWQPPTKGLECVACAKLGEVIRLIHWS